MFTTDSSCRDWEAVLRKKPADQDKGRGNGEMHGAVPIAKS